MKIDYYEEFVKLSETGSFSRTADQLPFSQAALTQHIQLMEKTLGVSLFERSTRKVELNEYGSIVLPFAKRIAKLKAEAISAIAQQLEHTHYDFSVGFYPAAARYDFVGKLQKFQSEHPEISLRFRELLPETLKDSMENGEFDFIVYEEHEGDMDSRYDRLTLDKDTLVAAVSDSHPLADYGEALLTQLSKEQLYTMPEHTFVHKLSVAICKKKGFSPNITYTSYSIKNIMDMIAQRSGAALLIKKPAQSFEAPGIKIIDLIPPIYSSVSLLYHGDKLNNFGRCFLTFMEKEAGN